MGRSSGEGNGNPFQFSGLRNPVERGTWQAAVHGITHELHDQGPILYFLFSELITGKVCSLIGYVPVAGALQKPPETSTA